MTRPASALARNGPGFFKTLLVLWVCFGCTAFALRAQEGWQEALRNMPLGAQAPLNRDNCLPLLLRAFQSNGVVKALVILPAVSDDFYLISRSRPRLNLQADDLLTAITALTNATALRVTFIAPFLLLHLERDELAPGLIIKHKPTAQRLPQQRHLAHAAWSDAHWQQVQPALQEALRMKIQPAAASPDAWHFARFNVSGWNLADWDLLAALSLTSRTTISVQRNRLVFRIREAKPSRRP